MDNVKKTDDLIEVAKLLSITYCEAKEMICCLENLTLKELENELVTLRATSGALTTFRESFQHLVERKCDGGVL